MAMETTKTNRISCTAIIWVIVCAVVVVFYAKGSTAAMQLVMRSYGDDEPESPAQPEA